jgi:hypothetical protein
MKMMSLNQRQAWQGLRGRQVQSICKSMAGPRK